MCLLTASPVCLVGHDCRQVPEQGRLRSHGSVTPECVSQAKNSHHGLSIHAFVSSRLAIAAELDQQCELCQCGLAAPTQEAAVRLHTYLQGLICDDGCSQGEAFWQVTHVGACSQSCGGGTQYVEYQCMGKYISQSYMGLEANCSDARFASVCGSNPSGQEQCNMQPCLTYQWLVTDWSLCSKVCDGGSQMRSVTCTSSTGAGGILIACCNHLSQHAISCCLCQLAQHLLGASHLDRLHIVPSTFCLFSLWECLLASTCRCIIHSIHIIHVHQS